MFEKEHALRPDTIKTKEIVVLDNFGKTNSISFTKDSIYTNKNKINFIQKHNLQTSSIKFIN